MLLISHGSSCQHYLDSLVTRSSKHFMKKIASECDIASEHYRSLVVCLHSALEWFKYNMNPEHIFTYQTIIQRILELWCYYNRQWIQYQLPDTWTSRDVMAKKLVLVGISHAVWGPLLAKQNVLLQYNWSLVKVINKASAKPAIVMHLLRCLWLSMLTMTLP